MKLILCTIRVSLLIFAFIGCSKDGGGSGGSGGSGGNGGGGSGVQEAPLSVSVSPDPGTGVATALSASYAFQLLINSAPPANGVKIDINVLRESDNSSAFTQAAQTTSNSIKTVDLSLSNLQMGIIYLVKIDATSQNTATNKASTSFRLARKS